MLMHGHFSRSRCRLRVLPMPHPNVTVEPVRTLLIARRRLWKRFSCRLRHGMAWHDIWLSNTHVSHGAASCVHMVVSREKRETCRPKVCMAFPPADTCEFANVVYHGCCVCQMCVSAFKPHLQWDGVKYVPRYYPTYLVPQGRGI